MAIAADGGPADKLRDEASFACQSVFDVRSGADAELVRLADAKAEQLAEVLGSACTAGEASRLGDALVQPVMDGSAEDRSEEHTSELQSLMRISYAVFCLKKKKHIREPHNTTLRVTDMIVRQ